MENEEKLSSIVSLIEREQSLHQEWLSTLGMLEVRLQEQQPPGELPEMLQSMSDQVSRLQAELMEAVSLYASEVGFSQSPTFEHILTLQTNIDLLREKISQKVKDVQAVQPRKRQTEDPTISLQLAVDPTLDILKYLLPR